LISMATTSSALTVEEEEVTRVAHAANNTARNDKITPAIL